MKSVKIILLGAAAAIIAFSVNSADTYSFFKSTAVSNSNIFQTGTLKMELNGGGEDANTVNFEYGKFGAGDSVSRDFNIKNSGSIPFISKLSILEESNPLFNYLRCEINIYYKENTAPEASECRYNLYSGTLKDFAESGMIIKYKKDKSAAEVSELTPNQSLRCELVLTLPEDVILPDKTVSNDNESISINIYTTQVNNADFK